MIKDTFQRQEAGDNSTNYQAATIIQTGLTYGEVREIALDVFRANFLTLKAEAAEVASERAQFILENLLDKVKDKLVRLEAMREPGMQAALYLAQKGYALSGDENVAELLIDLLVKRIDEDEPSLERIVLDESLKVVPKLTKEQLNLLTTVFLIAYSRQGGVRTWESFQEFLDVKLKSFVDGLSVADSSFQHLDYCGCGALSFIDIRVDTRELLRYFRQSYPHLFKKGFDVEDFTRRFGDPGNYPGLLTTCIHNPDKLQEDITEEKIINGTHSAVTSLPDGLGHYLIFSGMSDAEMKDLLLTRTEIGARLFEIWDGEGLNAFRLTSVGLAIGKANFDRTARQLVESGMWPE